MLKPNNQRHCHLQRESGKAREKGWGTNQGNYPHPKRFCRRAGNGGSNRQGVLSRVYRLSADGISSKGQACIEFYVSHLLPYLERSFERCRASGDYKGQSFYEDQQFG